MQLDRTVFLMNSYEGRDKLTKSLQFMARLLKWFYLEKLNQKDVADNYGNLSNGFRDARKLFSLGKSLSDLHKIIQLLQQKTLYSADYFLNLGIRVNTFIQWIYENLSILITIKFIKGDISKMNKSAATFLLFSCVLTLVQLIKNIMINHENWVKAQNSDSKKQIQILQQAKNLIMLNLVKTLGDFIVALQGSTLYPQLTGKNINESILGISGLTSGIIACYQNY